MTNPFIMVTAIDKNLPEYRALFQAARRLPAREGVYLVGGCVRDLLINQPPADYDLAVSGAPERYAQLLAAKFGGRPIAIGPDRHRLFRVVAGSRIFDLSPLVGDTIAADLEHRDFTINAMAFYLAGQHLVDPLGGLHDLQTRTLKMASPRAFVNDPLRQLRAFRLAAQFGCRIEPDTLAAVKTLAGAIQTCAGERIRAELFKLLGLKGATQFIEQMADAGLLYDILPELAALPDCSQNEHHSFDVWTHTLAACRQLETWLEPAAPDESAAAIQRAVAQVKHRKQVSLLKMALLLHDVGKPATRSADAGGKIHFYGHGRRGAALAVDICNRLKCSRVESEYIGTVVRQHNRPLFLYLLQSRNRLSARAITRFFIHCGDLTPAVLIHAIADYAGKRPVPGEDLERYTRFIESLLTHYFDTHTRRQAEPGLLTGRDLITHFGLSPSPLFRKLLEKVETARLAGEISDKQQALDLVRSLLDHSAPPEKH